ncbi:MAG: hypothetical protein AAB472_00080 [Patescibacteria group bacterium]
MRRALIITASALLLIGIGVGIYFFFFTNSPSLSVNTGVQLPTSGNDSGTGGGATPTVQELGVPSPGAGTEVAPRLIRITDRPVALGVSAVFLPGVRAPKVGTSTTQTGYLEDPDVKVSYIERESGNIYTYRAHVRTLTRLTNKTLPGVVEASWVSDGSLAFVRFVSMVDTTEQLQTYALPAQSGEGYFLEQNLAQVFTTGSSTLVTLLATTNGSTATISNASGANPRTLFTSRLSAITLQTGGGSYVATTKASAGADGYAFQVDKAGTFTRVLGALPGLSTRVSPSGKFLLYSFVERGTLVLAVLDMSTHTATRLPLSTLADKCTWSLDSSTVFCGVPTAMKGTFPDDWYQGVVSFTDRLWKIDMSQRVASMLIDPSQAGDVAIDAVSLTVDSTSDVLFFTNKQGGALYAYDL